ncbi:RNA polymerase sigma factor FliA [Oleiphilus sp. HI0009]|uniref:RNA polymerase sigma factor FliA n=2 Tax=Oleiphilus TaxID=141450 RepID=UPI0007C3EE51|nr:MULTISPECIES: RNA polymerase sigma factor FliA [unclassified Oleiphilus]KZX76993.1 RNA polymerase sigma factor FliA [Oleiphilus sp. HI0009]KZY66112.1 RNA polymerase sigma factor FliA [Oleiphilus sp. HI0066]KZY70007.1 RNA polymerase sigma factor FliA [Oleiphilus sp. HI0067]
MYSEKETQYADELIVKHAPLVKRIAHHLMARLPSSVQVDDLIQAGMIGLLEAAQKYESDRGASFETYAGIRIRGAMMDEVRKGDWVPRSVHRNARRIAEAVKAIEARTGQDASDEQIAAELEMSLDEYFACLKDSNAGKLFSLEELAENSEGQGFEVESGSTADRPSDFFSEQQFKKALASEIERLPERENLVLSLYYEEEMNLKEIGLILDVSESRVSQIHSQAAIRLKSRMYEWIDS